MIKSLPVCVILTCACNAFDKSPENSAPPNLATPSDATLEGVLENQTLLFAGSDPTYFPSPSSILSLDLTSLNSHPEKLLTGESSDPMMFAGGGEVLLFNRYFDNQNYRRLSANAGYVEFSQQQRFAGGDVGDPHDVLYLGADRLLLAHYIEGQLVLMQQTTGRELGRVRVDWDLPANVSLKPESLWMTTVNDQRYIYIIHQGITFGEGAVAANGSQQIFVLRYDDLQPIDLDASKPKIQGIRLRGSFPSMVRFAQRDKLLLVSLCSQMISSKDSKCVAAIEELDPRANTIQELWNLDEANLFMNSAVTAIPGPNPETVFANVIRKTDDVGFIKQVVRLNIEQKQISVVYNFKSESAGYWSSFFDESRATLYVGELGDTTPGKFIVFPEGENRREIVLDVVPIAGAFLAKTP